VWTEEKPPIEDLVNELKHYGVAGMQKGIRKLDQLDARDARDATPMTTHKRVMAAKAAQIAVAKKQPVKSAPKQKLNPKQQQRLKRLRAARQKRIAAKLKTLRANGLKDGKPHNYTKAEVDAVLANHRSRMGATAAKAAVANPSAYKKYGGGY
jgi:hypothetical protein